MDERSVDWMSFVSRDARFVARQVPQALHTLLRAHVAADGTSYLGWETNRAELGQLGQFESVVLIRPRGIRGPDLERIGFRSTLDFSVLPSLDQARWFIPSMPPQIAARGLDLYVPYRFGPRVKKQAASMLARVGLLDRVGDRLVLGRRAESALERGIDRATGGAAAYLALSTGSAQAQRKPTLQVMGRDGHVIGYAKLARSAESREALGREASWLRALAERPGLRGAIPRLIATFETEDAVANIQTPGPRRAGPTTFGQPHHAFLRALVAETRRRMPFHQTAGWRLWLATFEGVDAQLSQSWRDRLHAALGRLGSILGDRELTVATAHRDFRPRNHRLTDDGRLFVFDWEMARPEMVPLYDVMHFEVEAYAMFEGGTRVETIVARILEACRRWGAGVSPELVRCQLLGYLVDRSLSRLQHARLREGSRDDPLLRFMAALLDRQGEWMPSGPWAVAMSA
jgi:hypothetical protein